MKRKSPWFQRLILCAGSILILGLILYGTAPFWMARLGYYLIQAEAPGKADIAVLLAGDPIGERMMAAAQLVGGNLVPRVLVSGPRGSYGTWESDLAIEWAVRQGKPREWFVPLHMTADSTAEEAVILLTWLREHNIKSINVVTSNFHTRRAGQIWRKVSGEICPRYS